MFRVYEIPHKYAHIYTKDNAAQKEEIKIERVYTLKIRNYANTQEINLHLLASTNNKKEINRMRIFLFRS